ncbi:J domain-containing protein [Vampirovibrio chlorellavorus]|uniref:J domain-containing protein n=1 Tax=Vampirovibrio chlorellavorus TaxID=758823 RepID=UPI0026F080AD|nr:J domain-containing protein [Vampirovibrio chlorellavorus]
MASFKNYYLILGVEAFADVDAVRSAFRKLARQHHPDLNAGNAQAEERFKEINEAYEILSNPEKRAMHDASLRAMKGNAGGNPAEGKAAYSKQGDQTPKGKASPPPASEKKARSESAPDSAASTGKQAANKAEPGKDKGSTTSINDLFESFLKKGFQEKSAKAANAAEGVFSAKKDSGKKSEAPQRGEDVQVKVAITPQEAMDGVVKTVNVQHNEICRRCSGTGKVNGLVCTACGGDKILVRLKKIDVRIPAGVKNGSRVRVAKEGGRGYGGAENGDLFLQIEISVDAGLRIEGLDVYGDVVIALTDAVLGCEIEVSTLHGPMKMTVPPGTQPGKVFRLKERGVQSGLTQGDHYVTVSVVVPDALSAREKELYQELARLRPEKSHSKKS